MIYGYARISRKTQNLDRQIRNIKGVYPDAVIVTEAFTGTIIQRKGLEKILSVVKPGDVIVFDSVSRMSRNAVEGYELYERLFHMGIELKFLKEPQINTSTYKNALTKSIPMTGTAVDLILDGINRYTMELARDQIRLAFAGAQKEVDDLHVRTKEGIATARMNGKQIGGVRGATLTVKKAGPAKRLILKHSRTFGGTLSDPECMRLAGVSHNTYYKYKRALVRERETRAQQQISLSI